MIATVPEQVKGLKDQDLRFKTQAFNCLGDKAFVPLPESARGETARPPLGGRSPPRDDEHPPHAVCELFVERHAGNPSRSAGQPWPRRCR
jgi:hypothetical protein